MIDSQRNITHRRYRPQSCRQGLRLWKFLIPSSPPANQSTTVSRRSNPCHAGAMAHEDDGAPDVDLTGTYYNAGYGAGVLCSAHSSPPSCQNILDASRSVDPSLSPNSTSTDLFASWVPVFSTHMRFTYTNDSRYSISIGSIHPQGYGKNSTPFSTLAPSATAEFLVENEKVFGLGWNNTGGNSDVQRAGSVEETSEVWFVKEARVSIQVLPAILLFSLT